MGITSYAQNFEDVLLNRVFAGLNDGFYVDIGAYDPTHDSVTKAFYDRGWNGINVEPGDIFERLAAARPRDLNLHMAVFDHVGEITFAQHTGCYAGLSHVQDENSVATTHFSCEAGVEMRTVPCDTLTNILNSYAPRRSIAFLKMAAKGSEAAIIRSTDWRIVRPLVLVVEATLPLSTQLDNQHWEPILLEQGYVRAYFDGVNCFYVPEERSDLLQHFDRPANVLDGFTPAALSACHEELRTAHKRIQDLVSETIKLQVVLSELRRQYDAQIADSNEQLHRTEQRQIVLDRLVHELRWPDGPRAVRAALPLARMLRRLKGTEAPAMPAMQTRVASPGPPALSAPGGPARRRSLARRLALLGYAPIRRFARPIARRSRAFLTAEIRFELARLNEANREEFAKLGKMLEVTLLTLALEGDGPPDVSGGVNPPTNDAVGAGAQTLPHSRGDLLK